MTPHPGGVIRPVCCICGDTLALSWPCQQEHPEHCHDCWARSFQGGLEARQHRGPAETLVLSPRDVAALARYTQHVQRTVGTEEDTP